MLKTEIDYSVLLAEVKQEFPDFKLVRKEDSRLMKFLGTALKVLTLGKANAFMTRFTTTLGTTVYTTVGWEDRTVESRMTIIRHERIHMRQARKEGRFLFSLKYALLPLPVGFAHFRKKYEQEAYEESLAAMQEYYGDSVLLNEGQRDGMIAHFTSAEYFWTWPWKKSIANWYDNAVARLLKSNV